MTDRSAEIRRLLSCSPEVMSGAPVFRGTRVPVHNLFDYLAAGDRLEAFLAQFPTVKREQATALLAVAEELILARLGEGSSR